MPVQIWTARHLQTRSECYERHDAACNILTTSLTCADLEGATPEDTIEVLKKAYRKQALRLHPDKNPDGPAPFLEMQRCYNALLALVQARPASSRPRDLLSLVSEPLAGCHLRLQCLQVATAVDCR